MLFGGRVTDEEAGMKTKMEVEYVEYVSDLPFQAVVEAFEKATGSVEGAGYRQAVAAAETTAEFEQVIRAQESTSGFMRFLTLDHGAWMHKFEGATTRAKMYTIGNPLIARTMLRHEMAAGLNVPVRVYIYQYPGEKTHFGFHLPSSLMAVYGNAEVMKACEALDEKLERLAKAVTRGGGN
jgi:uncharacterized protein (DUF302 family)